MTDPAQASQEGAAPVLSSAGHLVPLGQTGWCLWREGALRSTGFAAAGLLAVCDHHLARAVDDHHEGGWTAGGSRGSPPWANTEADIRLRAAYQAAVARLSAAVAEIAGDQAFREAVAWQNPALIGSCLDKLVRGEPRNVRGRLHESTVVRYLQRYLLKNDTIGFFGPVGWVELSPGVAGLRVRPGAALLAARTTHFEVWAIDELARVLAARPELADWLVPRRALAVTVTGATLRRPLRPLVELTDAEIATLERCDGRQTVREVTSGVDGACARDALSRLAKLGAVHVGFDGPVDSWPERALRRRLEAIGDAPARRAALASLDALCAARDRVSAARDADDVVQRTNELAEIFHKVTGAQATRRHGEAYAGRTLLYQDTRRDVAVVAGRAVLAELTAPLGLLLDSARWLVARVAGEYRALLTSLYDEEVARSGSPDVPLGYLIARAAPDLTASGRALPPPVRAAVGEFQRRWRLVLTWPEGARRHDVSSATLIGPAATAFECEGTSWRAAVHHSPDIMIAAADPEAVRRGEFLLVLGELHLAVNSLDNRFFVQHHDDPARLLAAAEADAGDGRIYAALPKNSPFVSSRVWPPIALLSPRYTYWTWSGELCSVEPPGPVLPGAGLVVRRRGSAFVAASGAADPGVPGHRGLGHRGPGHRGPGYPRVVEPRVVEPRVVEPRVVEPQVVEPQGALCPPVPALSEHDVIEVIGEILSTAVVNAFRPFAAAPHTPRITIDRLVVARESWTFAAADTAWAFVKDELARYAAARAWRAENGLPERIFVVLPVERKPIAVDFTSLPLVNALAKEVRRTAEAGSATFSVTEMLPDIGDLWLHDKAGQRYASELRLVAFDAHAAPGDTA